MNTAVVAMCRADRGIVGTGIIAILWRFYVLTINMCCVIILCWYACRDAIFCVSRAVYELTVNSLLRDSFVWDCL